MSVFDFFNSFFGSSPNRNGRPPEFRDDDFGFSNPNDPRLNPNFDNDDMKLFSSMFDFRMMTDPFEMHQFVEQKINEIMKSFTSPDGLPGFHGFGVVEPSDVPAVMDRHDPRDHYLKPGAKLAPPNERTEDKNSQPITTWLDAFAPKPSPDGNRTFSSFKSVIRKTVTLPDGTVKTEEIIRNSDGSEEIRESHSESNSLISPFVGPDFSGILEPPKMPEYKDPRYQFLKPGYERLNPNSEKIDKDLDKQIEQAGIESLPPFTKEPEVLQSNINRVFKSFSRRTITLPNGVVESEEITRNADGSEQRVVTHTWPDGTVKSVTVPTDEPLASDKYQDNLNGGYDKPTLSFALRGVKDFIDMLFK